MSNGVTSQQGGQSQGISSFTPFVNFMLTAVPAAIVVVAGWLFGNIFAELQHQRQRQENLVREVTAMNRDLIALSSQFVDLREFYRNRYVERDALLSQIEKDILTLSTKMNVQQKERELQAIKDISGSRNKAPKHKQPNR